MENWIEWHTIELNLHTPQEPTLKAQVAMQSPWHEGLCVISRSLVPGSDRRSCSMSLGDQPQRNTHTNGWNIRTLSIRYNSLALKAGALAPMDEKNRTANITFASTCAEHWDFGGAGVQHNFAGRFEYFVHLLSRSLMFSHLLVSKFLQWKHLSACTGQWRSM